MWSLILIYYQELIQGDIAQTFKIQSISKDFIELDNGTMYILIVLVVAIYTLCMFIYSCH